MNNDDLKQLEINGEESLILKDNSALNSENKLLPKHSSMNLRRYLLLIAGVIVIAFAVPFLMGFMKITAKETIVEYPKNSSVVFTDKDISQKLANKFGNFISFRRNQIKTDEIKDYLQTLNFVEHCVVSVSPSGVLRITVYQKNAVARVYNSKGEQYYIVDNKRECSAENAEQNNVPHCMIASGDIKDRPYGKIDTSKYVDCKLIHRLAMMINDDDVLRQWISGIRKEKNRWYLLPTQGEYTIKLGDEALWREELTKLHYLIEYSFKPKGWEDYESIDLSFHNQVVCSKQQR